MKYTILISNWRNSLLCEMTRGALGADAQGAYKYPILDSFNILNYNLNLKEVLTKLYGP